MLLGGDCDASLTIGTKNGYGSTQCSQRHPKATRYAYTNRAIQFELASNKHTEQRPPGEARLEARADLEARHAGRSGDKGGQTETVPGIARINDVGLIRQIVDEDLAINPLIGQIQTGPDIEETEISLELVLTGIGQIIIIVEEDL